MKNILLRASSGAIYVALIVCSILFGHEWGFPLFCCVLTILGIPEFMKMAQSNTSSNTYSTIVDIVIGLSILIFHLIGYQILPIALLLIIIRMIMQLYIKNTNALQHIAYSIMSVVYIAFPLWTGIVLHFVYGKAILLLMFIMIWLNDTGAYIVGSTIGSHRLFARLSPKKSWEGFFGGLAFCVVTGYLAKVIFPEYFSNVSTLILVGMGFMVSVVATFGDLFESMIKRTVGVKDSGNLIPGHGGILDRIDSLLFVAPATLLYYFIFSYLF